MCYKCGEKDHLGHQCKPRKLNAISAATEEELEEALHQEETVIIPEEEIVDEAISLNALFGTEVPSTIKLRGEAKKNSLTILLDSESTQFFVYRSTKENRLPYIRSCAYESDSRKWQLLNEFAHLSQIQMEDTRS